MAYVINDTCVSCGSCAGECPVKCNLSGRRQIRDRCRCMHQLRNMCRCMSHWRYQRGLISHVLEEYIKAAALYLRQQLFCYDSIFILQLVPISPKLLLFPKAPGKKRDRMRRPPPFPCFPGWYRRIVSSSWRNRSSSLSSATRIR